MYSLQIQLCDVGGGRKFFYLFILVWVEILANLTATQKCYTSSKILTNKCICWFCCIIFFAIFATGINTNSYLCKSMDNYIGTNHYFKNWIFVWEHFQGLVIPLSSVLSTLCLLFLLLWYTFVVCVCARAHTYMCGWNCQFIIC